MDKTDQNTNKTFELCLLITEKCNLNCIYCYNDKSFKRTMSFDTATFEIDRMFNERKDYDSFNILFMGGEPFIAFDLIKQIVKYIDKKYPDKKTGYTTVTNGTLIKKEIQDWLIDHQSNFQTVFSIDGIPETQNTNRSESGQNIDWDFIKNKIKKPIINMVITPESLSSLFENAHYLHLQNVFIKSFLADGVEWKEKDENILATQLFELINFYISNSQIYPISILSMPIHLLHEGEPTRCGQGDNSYTIGVDGIQYACHRCSPFENNGNWTIPSNLLDLKEARYLDNRCKFCIVEKICNACPALNASIMYNPILKDIQCRLRKVLFKANAFFYINLLAEKPTHIALKRFSEEKRSALLKSAQIILKELEIGVPF